MSRIIDNRRFSNSYEKDINNQTPDRVRNSQTKKTVYQALITQGVRLDAKKIKEFMNNPTDTSMIGGNIQSNHNIAADQIVVTWEKSSYQKGLPRVIGSINGLDLTKFYSKEEMFEKIRIAGVSIHDVNVDDIPNWSKNIPNGTTDTHGKFTLYVGGSVTITNGPHGVYAGQLMVVDIKGDWENGKLPKNWKKNSMYKNIDKVEFIVVPYDTYRFRDVCRKLHNILLQPNGGVSKLFPLAKYVLPRHLNGNSRSSFKKNAFLLKASSRGILLQGIRALSLRGVIKAQTPKMVKKDMLIDTFIKKLRDLKDGGANAIKSEVGEFLKKLDKVEASKLSFNNMSNMKLTDGVVDVLTGPQRSILKNMETSELGLLKKIHKDNGSLKGIVDGNLYIASRLGVTRNPSDMQSKSDKVPSYINTKWDDDLSRGLSYAFSKTDIERKNFEFPSGTQKPSLTRDVNMLVQNSLPFLDASIIKMKKNYDNRIIGTALENARAYAKNLRLSLLRK